MLSRAHEAVKRHDESFSRFVPDRDRRRHDRGIPSRLRILVGIAVAGAMVVGDVGGARASYLEEQSSGLEALFNATGGEQWVNPTGWRDASLDICNWYGVACDSSGQNVTDLSLAGNGLAGNLTEAVGLFGVLSLVSVDLSDNDLVGPVAPGFGLMPNLVVLDLSRNNLSSIPAGWGEEASSLQHLSLQQNNISGTLPSAWLDVTSSSTSFPVVHAEETHAWLPELRTLAVGGNAITMSVYLALQSVIGFTSLQMLDLSGNFLDGSMDQSLDLHFCDGIGVDACDSTGVKTGASAIAIVLLASNLIEGGLTSSLPRSLSVLTVSDNQLSGPVPEDYSQLSVFMADGNEGLNGSALPSFASYDSTSSSVTRHGNLSCPVISGQYAEGRSMRLSLDPSYLNHSHCVCIEGMEGNSEDGCQLCPEGTYRGAATMFTTRFCVACPSNSRSTNAGAESVSQCKCESGYYDALAGAGDGDIHGALSCSACPQGSVGWDNPGAISLSACTCPAGHYLDDTAQTCAECEAGTYKTSAGNDASLCVPCAQGTYSSQTGSTSSDVCVPCGVGTYSTTHGAASSSVCLPCPSGTYSSKTGLFTADLCGSCPAGYYSEDEGATDVDVCSPCPQGTSSSEKGAPSRASCEACPDGLSSLEGSHECDLVLANSRRWLAIYLAVGASTLTGICVAYYTWQKKVHKKKKLMVDSRTDTPLKMTGAKRKAHMWAVFFHTLEAIDVITGNALFAYLLEIGDIQDFMQFIYWLVVSLGLALNVFRIYMIIWMRWLVNVSVAEKVDNEGKKVLVVYMPGNRYLPGRQRSDRRIMTPDDAKMVLELVKILKHLQINKFKVQLAVVMDLPLTVLNLWLLWMVDPALIKSALFLTSLIIAVFSAGKISTLIEYHLELRQRKRKLERLLLLELKSSKGGDDDDVAAEDNNSDHHEEDECFEHGHPETLLKFHGKSMRNIATTEAEDLPPLPRRRNRIRYLKLSPTRRSPKDRFKRKLRGASVGGGGVDADGLSPERPAKSSMSPGRNRPAAAAAAGRYATIPQDEEELN